METVSARLDISMYVHCPNDDCSNLIDLLNSDDTDGENHDDDCALLQQMFPENGSHDDFECEEVTCTECKTTFDVRGLRW